MLLATGTLAWLLREDFIPSSRFPLPLSLTQPKPAASGSTGVRIPPSVVREVTTASGQQAIAARPVFHDPPYPSALPRKDAGQWPSLTSDGRSPATTLRPAPGVSASSRLPGSDFPEPAAATLPVTLEFGLSSQLPAIVIAPPPDAPPPHSSTVKAEAAILQDFLSKTAPAPAADVATPSPGPTTAELPDEVWDRAVRDADERYRSLHGKEAYLRRSLEAGRISRQLPVSTPSGH